MTSLTFYGGVKEIGGNKILVEDEDKDTNVFLDFGMSFGQAGEYFTEFLQPRKCNGIKDFLEFGLLPNLKGVYRKDYVKHTGRKPEENKIDALFISHAHADHSSYIHFLNREIPLYGGSATKAILKTLEETSRTGFTELLTMLETFKCYKNQKGKMSRVTKRKKEYLYKREFNEMDKEKETEAGSFKVKRIPVNHSLPGASAYIIETDEGNIVYTGDLRFHGRKGEITEKFVEIAEKHDPIALITEGTRIKKEESKPEKEVCEEVKKEIEKTNGLAIVNFPVRDTERMTSFLEAAEETDRKLIVNTKQFRLLEHLEETEADAPKPDEVLIHLPNKSWGTITKDYPERIKKQDYQGWEKEYLDRENTVTSEDIKKNQEEYVYRCDFFQLKNLIDIKPKKGSRYIRSVTEPFDEEMEIQLEKAENWLKHFNLYPYKQVHCSGHANQKQIEKMIEKINPEKVYPIHTEHPGKFRRFKGKTKLVRKGKKYRI